MVAALIGGVQVAVMPPALKRRLADVVRSTWRLSTPTRELELTTSSRAASAPSASLLDDIAFFGRAAIRARDADALAFVGELASPWRDSDAPRLSIEELETRFEEAVRYGRVRCVERGRVERVAGASAPRPLPSNRVPSTRPARPTRNQVPEAPTGWLEVRLVNAFGEALEAVALEISHRGKREHRTTSASAPVRIEGVEARVGTVALGDVSAVRRALRRQLRGRAQPRTLPALPDCQSLALVEGAEAAIPANTANTLVLSVPLERVRLRGMHFDTNKCFLRPSAMRGIRRVVQVYATIPNGKLLVVGHTDAAYTEAYNLELSVERAEATRAFLKDDVDAWLAWFGAGKPAQKRWGDVETNAMVSALSCGSSVAEFQAWCNETRGTDLAVDGIMGDHTRRALVAAYMALDGTTLPESIEAVVHGVGEWFPREDLGDGARSEENRRVELFCFDDEIVPPPPGVRGHAGETEYPEWVAQVTATVDVDASATTRRVRLHNHQSRPMTEVRYRVYLDGQWGPRSITHDGWIDIVIESSSADSALIEWAYDEETGDYAYHAPVLFGYDAADQDEQTRARLHNLGYRHERSDLDAAARRFQADYRLPVEGLRNGALPESSRERLAHIYDADSDATRPA